MTNNKIEKIQIKICGITTIEDAAACVRFGADAIGLIFYPPSSRFVSLDKARDICSWVPGEISTVGVFVNEPFESIMKTVNAAGIQMVQLHGSEPPELVLKLKAAGLSVIKALFAGKEPSFAHAYDYHADAFLVECPGKSAHGGTGKSWDWGLAREIPGDTPLLLAGGLNPGNIRQAVEAARPDGVDVSSGVEREPGLKDYDKVRQFINAVRGTPCTWEKRRIFK